MGYRMGYFRVCGTPRIGGPHQPLPLAVDLDRAVFKRSIASAILRAAIRHSLPAAAWTLAQHSQNRAFAAWLLALRFPTMSVHLDLNPDVLELARLHGRFGAPVALITGMRREIALGVRNIVDLPSTIACLGAEGAETLSDQRKGRLLAGYYGAHRFAYAGGRRQDAASTIARRSFIVGATSASKRAGSARGAPVVALSGHVAWTRIQIPAAQLIGTVDPVRDLTTSAVVSQAIWDRDHVNLPAIAAEEKPEFIPKTGRKMRGRQT